jgi:hypothetical protein
MCYYGALSLMTAKERIKWMKKGKDYLKRWILLYGGTTPMGPGSKAQFSYNLLETLLKLCRLIPSLNNDIYQKVEMYMF